MMGIAALNPSYVLCKVMGATPELRDQSRRSKLFTRRSRSMMGLHETR